MTDMLACASTSLEPPVDRAVLAPGGSVSWDACECGQVWVRLIGLVPSASSQVRSSAFLPCGVTIWVVTLGVGVLRCAAVLDESGNAPSPAALSADTLQETADLAALSAAIQCCMTASPHVEHLSMLRWSPLGPDGGCLGGEFQFNVLMDNCLCVPDGQISQVSGSVGVMSGG